GRYVGETLGALEPGLGDGEELAAFDLCRRSRHGVEAEIDLAADEIGMHGTRSAIGHVYAFDLGRHVEHLRSKVLDGACARGTERYGARRILAQLDDVGYRIALVPIVGHQ